METKELLKKRVLVVGLGRSGFSAVQLLHRYGTAEIRVVEREVNNEMRDKRKMLLAKGIEVELGEHQMSCVDDIDIAVISPGISKEEKIIKILNERKIPYIGELELGFLYCRFPLIAVTGSNGKTTTVSLLNEVMKGCGVKTVEAGNIGIPFSDILLSGDKYETVCLEVSSFQLEDILEFEPFISVLLNITEDHLDRYSNFSEYQQAKLNLFKNIKPNQWVIINNDLKGLVKNCGGQKIFFSAEANEEANLFLKDNKIIFQFENQKIEILKPTRKHLIGKHNWENILAVIGVALVYDLPLNIVLEVINDFRGLPHRLEFVETIKTVNFYNDSKATNIDALIKALESFEGSKINLILGGKNKKGNFAQTRSLIADKVKKVFLIGEASDEIREALDGVVKMEKVADLEGAVQKAYDNSSRGDIVLLSPGCASFDMFESYVERGNVFKEAVNHLKKKEILIK